MNVYDFDGTIYRGDSSWDFCLFCMKRDPSLFRYLPTILRGAFRYLTKKISKTVFKEHNFAFLQGVSDVDRAVADFWKTHRRKLYPWYPAQKQPSDVIISASPDFLLAPVCESLGVTLIASPVDKKSGRFHGENCHDEEKVRRFRAACPDAAVDAFYSDSLSDLPMARLAKRAYFIRRGTPSPWQIPT